MAKEKPIIICTDLIPATLDGRKTVTRRVIKDMPEKWHRGYTSFENNPNGNEEFIIYGDCGTKTMYARYKVGDLLWVREAFGIVSKNHPFIKQILPMFEYTHYSKTKPDCIQNGYELLYKATQEIDPDFPIRWRSSRFMPKWAARIWLEVLDVRAERLQEITEEDAKAEGIQLYEYGTEYDKEYGGREKNMSYSVGYGMERLALSVMPNKASGGFRRLWDSLNAKRGYGWDVNPWVWRYEFKVKQGSDNGRK